MVECSSCHKKFKDIAEFDGHRWTCDEVNSDGIVRHAIPVQKRFARRGSKVAEVTSAPVRETR